MEEKLITLEHLSADEELLKAEHEEIDQSHAVVVRHGHSQSNAGLRSNSIYEVYLAEAGHKQAKHFADFLPKRPTKIVHSPFVRTRLTADPSIEKFPDIEVVEWPIQEYTFLNPEKYKGTTQGERKVYTKKYWEEASPEYRDGGIAESFGDLWRRVEKCREDIANLAPGSLIFTHGQFMQMLWMQCETNFNSPSKAAMIAFKILETRCKIANTARIAVDANGDISKAKVSHLPAELITY